MSTLTLLSSDSVSFTVERDIIKPAGKIENLITSMGLDSAPTSEPIPLPNVDGAMLKMVIDWLTQHKGEVFVEREAGEGNTAEDVPEWDKEFLAVDQQTLFALVTAADDLDVKGLLENCCKTIASQINGKTAVEIGQHFNIECDHSPEELEAIRKENEWCEQ